MARDLARIARHGVHPAHLIQGEVIKLLADVTRMKERMGSLHKHFAQASGDLEQLNVSTDKISGRAAKIESMDLAEPTTVSDSTEKPLRLAAG